MADPATPAQPATILLVEDVQSEVILTRISLDNANMPYTLTILKQGRDVVPYLADPAKPRPDLILLDLGLPDVSGEEILAQLADKDERVKAIPIIILTGFQNKQDLKEKYPLNIVAYLNKPLQPKDIRDTLFRLQWKDLRNTGGAAPR